MHYVTFIKSFALRFMIALLIVGGAIVLVVWQPYLAGRRLVASQKSDVERAITTLKEARETISTLPDPGDLPIREPKTNRDYVDDVNKAVEKITPMTLPFPEPLQSVSRGRVGVKLVDRVNQLLTDQAVKESYAVVEPVMTQADRLLAYHAAMSLAVANVLGYNPGVDFQQFTLGDEETNARIDAARGGLQKAKERTQEANALYDDKSADEIVASITTLEGELDLLEKSGDLDGFSTNFQKEQEKIRANRAAFWRAASKNISTRLMEIESNLSATLEDWASI